MKRREESRLDDGPTSRKRLPSVVAMNGSKRLFVRPDSRTEMLFERNGLVDSRKPRNRLGTVAHFRRRTMRLPGFARRGMKGSVSMSEKGHRRWEPVRGGFCFECSRFFGWRRPRGRALGALPDNRQSLVSYASKTVEASECHHTWRFPAFRRDRAASIRGTIASRWFRLDRPDDGQGQSHRP